MLLMTYRTRYITASQTVSCNEQVLYLYDICYDILLSMDIFRCRPQKAQIYGIFFAYAWNSRLTHGPYCKNL